MLDYSFLNNYNKSLPWTNSPKYFTQSIVTTLIRLNKDHSCDKILQTLSKFLDNQTNNSRLSHGLSPQTRNQTIRLLHYLQDYGKYFSKVSCVSLGYEIFSKRPVSAVSKYIFQPSTLSISLRPLKEQALIKHTKTPQSTTAEPYKIN